MKPQSSRVLLVKGEMLDTTLSSFISVTAYHFCSLMLYVL